MCAPIAASAAARGTCPEQWPALMAEQRQLLVKTYSSLYIVVHVRCMRCKCIHLQSLSERLLCKTFAGSIIRLSHITCNTIVQLKRNACAKRGEVAA